MNIQASEQMMRAAMNAGEMPDESNAWAAVEAVIEVIEETYEVIVIERSET
jgi:hypothetical protein